MNKPPLSSTIASVLSLAALTPALVLPPGAFANGDGTFGVQSADSVAARELARRADYARRAEVAIEVAARAYKERDYETAVAQYKLACDLITPAEYTRVRYRTALDGFCNASIKLAEQRIAEGRYADAENILKLVLSESYNPRYRAAVVLLHRLETPGYFNRTIGPVFRGKSRK